MAAIKSFCLDIFVDNQCDFLYICRCLLKGAMAKVREKSARKARFAAGSLPFTRKNYIIFGIGILMIIIGYFFLAQGPADSFLSLSVAPVFLVVGYCILIPLSILYRDRGREPEAQTGD